MRGFMRKNKNNKKKKIQFFQKFRLDKDSSFSTLEVVIIIFVSIVFGIVIGYLVTYGNSSLRAIRTNAPLNEIVKTYKTIIENYYDAVDEEELSRSAIKGMLSSLDDPYSLYLDEDGTSDLNNSVEGRYIGIGISIEYKNGDNVVTSVVEDGPAAKAGVREGDIVLSIDGHDCTNLYSGQLSEFVDGDVGTTLKMIVRRENEEKMLSITRDYIEVQNVESEMIDEENKIGYLKLKIFATNSYDQFVDALSSLENNGIRSLIIDVRDNPGGHLLQTRQILSLFFDKKTVLYQLESNGSRKKVYSSSKDVRTYPIVVLINGDTASSAEILTACFQENYDGATVIGTNSYGKGNVQKSLSLSSGSSVKFTVQKWFTPKGNSISNVGVTPDVILQQSPTYYINFLREEDSQLQEAIQTLKES